MQSASASQQIPLGRVLTVAAVTGVVTAFVGALFARLSRFDEEALAPEHPMFGR